MDFATVTELDAQNPVAGDIRLDGVELALVEGTDAIAQEVEVRLRWWRGEWFLDVSQGVPYLQEIVGKGVSLDTARAILRREIEQVPGVARVTRLDVELDGSTRRMTASFEARTTSGESISAVDVPVGSRSAQEVA